MRCRFVNDTDLSQNCILNIFGALEFPAPEHCVLQLPEDAALVDANDYTQYTYAKPRPWDNENPDGMHKGEFADGNFYHAHGLGDRCENYHVDFLGLEPFGCTAGDKVVYTLPSLRPTGATLLLRYRTVTPGAAAFTVNGVAAELPESDSLTFAALPYDGADTLTLESRGAPVWSWMCWCCAGRARNRKSAPARCCATPSLKSKKKRCTAPPALL